MIIIKSNNVEIDKERERIVVDGEILEGILVLDYMKTKRSLSTSPKNNENFLFGDVMCREDGVRVLVSYDETDDEMFKEHFAPMSKYAVLDSEGKLSSESGKDVQDASFEEYLERRSAYLQIKKEEMSRAYALNK